MKSFIKKVYPYVIAFIIFLFTLLFFNVRNADTVWNYGMAHAIRLGEIPYKDFNIISMPLYPLIMSLGLFIKDTYFVYILEQAIFCVVLFFFIYKLLDKKTILYFLLISIPLFSIYLPNYNFLAFLLVVILIYLEKQKKVNDKYIGIILGLLFITKHTIGIVFILLSLLSTFNFKKITKRLIYLFIPILLFIIYLLITNSLYDCINLSILGLFDFGKSNNSISPIFLIISILLLIYNIYLFKKNPKDKYNYYLLSSFSFIIPIINMDHAMFLVGIFLIIILDRIKIKKKYNNKLLITSSVLLVFLMILNFYSSFSYYSDNLNNSFDKFHTRFISKDDDLFVSRILDEYKSYDNSYMISMDSMIYDIESNHKITYYDVPLYGNFGYNGIDNLKKDILSHHRSYFFIQNSSNPQFISGICEFIKEKGTLVKVVDNYKIYYIE